MKQNYEATTMKWFMNVPVSQTRIHAPAHPLPTHTNTVCTPHTHTHDMHTPLHTPTYTNTACTPHAVCVCVYGLCVVLWGCVCGVCVVCVRVCLLWGVCAPRVCMCVHIVCVVWGGCACGVCVRMCGGAVCVWGVYTHVVCVRVCQWRRVPPFEVNLMTPAS